MALSLYRKYRPEVFADVVGQEHVEKTLTNAIAEGAVAHAYLFCGPRGTGKTTTARLLAKALLCDAGPSAQPDGTCPQCLEIAQGTHPDVFELDAASRTGVDNVREEIIGRVNFAPSRGRYKIYIIDEVHMLSTAAFNALLKTLEEPPEHVVFVLCTTDPHKVPETIQSRCQRFDFRRFSIEEIVGYLERICKGEGYRYEPEALEFIAAKAAGGMRDATTALEQAAVFTAGDITADGAMRMFGQIDVSALFEIAGHIARRDAASCFVWVDELVGKGVDLAQFARDLTSHFRDLYVTEITGGGNGIIACTEALLEQYRVQARQFGGPDRLARALDVCGALVAELRNSADARLSVEIAMTRLTRPQSQLTLESLAERLEALEQGTVTLHAAPSPIVERIREDADEFQAPAFAETDVFEEASVNSPAVEADLEPIRPVAEVPAFRPEPEPEPEPEPVVVAVHEDMSPERLRLAFLSVLKREDPSVAALLGGVSLVEESGAYHILFPTGSDFQMRLAGGSEARGLIGRCLAEVVGREVSFDSRIGSFAGLASDEAPSSSMASVPSHHAEDDAYYDNLAAAEDAGHAFGGSDTSSIADALAAFGEGVMIQEINDDK